MNNPPKNFLKYCNAKKRGEDFCKKINSTDKKKNIFISRLPRLNTDLNLSLYKTQTNDVITNITKEFEKWLNLKIT